MNFSKIAVKRPVTTLMLMLIIVILGAVSLSKLPLDLYPKMDLPYAIAMVSYPNAGPEEVESLITRPLERQLSTVEKLKTLSSISTDGTSIIVVQFQDGTDMQFASLNMREKVDLIKDYLPEDSTAPMILTMDPTMIPIMEIYASADMDFSKLYTLLDDEIIPNFERTEGVAAASIFGGVRDEVNVTFDQEKLAGYNISLSQVSQILAAENINMPSGSVERGSKKMVVRTIGEFKSADDIKKIPVTLPATREIIYLDDIATIEEGQEEQTSIARVNGLASIGINITKQSTANTVDAADHINETLAELKEKYPEVNFTLSFDQSDYIRSSVSNVAEAALLGCLFAVIIIFLFLRNVPSTLIIALSIPVSIIATFILMYFSGITLNMLSLGGLAIGVGMLVDDSIVVLENIYRVRSEEGLSAHDAAINGAGQVITPVFASTMTKIAVFLPIVFVQGMAASMFKEFSYTISFALLASLVVALSVVPMLSSRLMHGGEVEDQMRIGKRTYRFKIIPLFTKCIDWLTEKYLRLIRYALSHRKQTVAIALIILLLSVSSVAVVGGELLPSSDQSSLTVSVETPYGTSLAEKDAIVKQVEEYVINNIPELTDCTVSIGASSIFSTGTGDNASTVRVNLADKKDRKRSTDEVADQVRDGLKFISAAKITVAVESMSLSLSGGSSIQIYLRGDDLTTLRTLSDEYVNILKDIDGTADVHANLTEGSPEVKIILNRNNAAYYGITAYQLSTALESALSGSTATTLKLDGTEIDVRLSLNDSYQESIENLKQILIPATTGDLVTVGQIADFEYDNSPSEINRQDQVRTVTISASLSGRDLQSVSNDIKTALDHHLLPVGYTYEFAGTQKEMIETFSSLAQALLLSIVLVFMILASQFESLIQPLIIMLAIPFALSGAFLSLFIVGMPLSLPAFMGIIMLMGVVVNNSILLIDFINQNKNIYPTRNEAIINAGKYRLRPILMTMLTTCLGLLPIALAVGEGAEIEAPMGVTVIGGLLFSTVITLVIVPVFYSIIDDKSQKRQQKKQVRKALKEEILASEE